MSLTDLREREVLNSRLGTLDGPRYVSLVFDLHELRDATLGAKGGCYVLRGRAAVDSSHGNAERTGLKEIMIGKAFDKLYKRNVSYIVRSSDGVLGMAHTSAWVPVAPRERFWHSIFRSARLRVEYSVALSETLAGCADWAPVMCRPRR